MILHIFLKVRELGKNICEEQVRDSDGKRKKMKVTAMNLNAIILLLCRLLGYGPTSNMTLQILPANCIDEGKLSHFDEDTGLLPKDSDQDVQIEIIKEKPPYLQGHG